MVRALALLGAVLLLPACHGDGDDFDQDLLITNNGASTVTVQVDHEDGSGDNDLDIIDVPAGSTISLDYDGDIEVNVLITRKSDNALLYAASFDQDDFDDADGTIQIIVTP